jgi:hypothetical protein
MKGVYGLLLRKAAATSDAVSKSKILLHIQQDKLIHDQIWTNAHVIP